MRPQSHRKRPIELVRELVLELGPLASEVVVVGGCAPALYDLNLVDVAPTEDIDLMLDASYVRWTEFIGKLRDRGFRDEPEHVGRLTKGDLLVDILPVDDRALPVNRWYREAFDTRIPVQNAGIHVIHFSAQQK